MRKRTRRGRTPYVRLLRPQPKSHLAWRTESLNVATGKYQRRVIPPEWAADASNRQTHCRNLSKAIMLRLRDDHTARLNGEVGKPVDDALQEWLRDFGNEYPKSAGTYESGTRHFSVWAAAQADLTTLDDVTRPLLERFRGHLNQDVVAPGTRGKIRTQTLSFLRWCFKRDYLPGFSHVDLVTFDPWRTRPQAEAPYLPEEYQQIFGAAQRLYEHSHRSDNKMRAVDPFPLLVLTTLSGMRIGAACKLLLEDFRPNTVGASGEVVGSLQVRPGIDKGGRPREILLDFSPGLRRYLMQVSLSRPRGQTLAGITVDQSEDIAVLMRKFGADRFKWKTLRSSAASYLTSSGDIFGSASADQSADRLGHSAQTARTFYVTVIAALSRDAKTIEAAMQIEDIIDGLCGAPSDSAQSTSAV